VPPIRLVCDPREFVGMHVVVDGIYENRLIAMVRAIVAANPSLFKDSVALDIGANIGCFCLSIADLFAHVYAFEPGTKSGAVLATNIAYNRLSNVTVSRNALSDGDGEMTLYEFDENLGGTSLHRPEGNHASPSSSYQVPVSRGDTIVPALCGDARIGLIKLDVEGHEAQALAGLANTIGKHAPIILFEANDRDSLERVLHVLRRYAYTRFFDLQPSGWPLDTSALRKALAIAGGIALPRAVPVEGGDRRYEMVLAAPDGVQIAV
jgi:FkbM family methyltransferase